jgi:lysophospholipase L1-like esterase
MQRNKRDGTDESGGGVDNKNLRINLSITTVTIVLIILGLEAFARIVLQEKPVAERFQLDQDLGWEWTPGYAAIESFHGFDYHMVVSSQGLRDKEIDIPKPAGNYRILAVGDSITEGPGVELEQTFSKQLQLLLQTENPRIGIEVFNCGTGDYGLGQELIWLRKTGLKFQPDLVILNIYLNDALGFKPLPPGTDRLINFLRRNSAFYTYYQEQYRDFLLDRERESSDFRFRYKESFDSEDWMTNAGTLTNLIMEADSDWGMAWDDNAIVIMEDRIEEIMELTVEHRVGLFVTIFPVSVQVYAQVDTPLGLMRPQQRLVRFLKERNILFVDLLPVLRQHRNEDLFFDQAHLKPEAHKIVAKAMFQGLGDFASVPTW